MRPKKVLRTVNRTNVIFIPSGIPLLYTGNTPNGVVVEAMAQITEDERLRLEHEALLRIVQNFANIRTKENPSPSELQDLLSIVQHRVGYARNILTDIKRRKRVPKAEDPLEQVCLYIRNATKHRGVEQDPYIMIERIGRRLWDASVAGFEEEFGIGTGATAIEAASHLLGKVKSVPVEAASTG